MRSQREEYLFFFSSRRRHTRFDCDWSSDVCSSDLIHIEGATTGIGVGVSIPASGAMLQNIYGGGPNMQTLVHVYSGREILLTGLVRSKIGRGSCRGRG